ncbi:hypothetical protein ACIP98_29005 [Streptomyces sp. NPDC088354]|uniref:hypothetical protein n=1 Tax=Streptomyces sp. NPDC088354 TaxID=3365856 RepID=UPI003830568F
MSTPTDDTHGPALGLERLRDELGEGLAHIECALQILVLRSEPSERTTAAHATKLELHDTRLDVLEAGQKAAEDHGARLTAVKKRMWTIGGGIAVVAVAVELGVNFLHSNSGETAGEDTLCGCSPRPSYRVRSAVQVLRGADLTRPRATGTRACPARTGAPRPE